MILISVPVNVADAVYLFEEIRVASLKFLSMLIFFPNKDVSHFITFSKEVMFYLVAMTRSRNERGKNAVDLAQQCLNPYE